MAKQGFREFERPWPIEDTGLGSFRGFTPAKQLAALCKCGHPRDQHEEEDDHSYCLGDVHLTHMGTDYCSCREYRAREERSGDTQHE